MTDLSRNCQTCDATPEEARPERAGEVTLPTCPGPCPTCGAAPWFERHPSPPEPPQPGDFVLSRAEFRRLFYEGKVTFDSVSIPSGRR